MNPSSHTVSYGFCAWPPGRIPQGPLQMTSLLRQWQAALPSPLPGNRRHRPCREGGRKGPANPPNAWQLLLYVSRARWGVRGCTDLALSTPVPEKDASDWPASFDRPHLHCPEGWKGPGDIRCRRLNPTARGEGAEHPGKWTNRRPQRSWRPSRERLRVISSAYSRWPPTGRPWARRVRRTPWGLTRRAR